MQQSVAKTGIEQLERIAGYLKTCDTLRALTSAECEQLAADCQHLTLRRGSTVYSTTDAPLYAYLLVNGAVQTGHIDGNGKHVIYALIQPGQIFGELGVCVPGSREERCDVTEYSSIVAIPASRLREILQQNAAVAFAMLTLCGRWRRTMTRRLESVLFQSTRHRVIRLLRELAQIGGIPDGDGIKIHLALSHQDLGRFIGVSRETITITLGQLRSEGLIRMDRRRIVLTQPDALQ